MTSLLSYFKTPSIGPAPGIEPATSRSAVDNAVPTELTLPRSQDINVDHTLKQEGARSYLHAQKGQGRCLVSKKSYFHF